MQYQMQQSAFAERNGDAGMQGGNPAGMQVNGVQHINNGQSVQQMYPHNPGSQAYVQPVQAQSMNAVCQAQMMQESQRMQVPPQMMQTAAPQNVQALPDDPVSQSAPIAPQLLQHTGRQHGRRTQAAQRMKERLQAAEELKTIKDWAKWILGLQWMGRNIWLLLSAVIGSGWFIFMIIMLSRALSSVNMTGGYEQAVQELRAGISVFMQMPSIISGFVGMVFNWLAWVQRKRGFALTAAILFGAAVLLSFGQSLGYGVFMAVNLLGYVQTPREARKRKYAQWQLGIDGSEGM